jgi:hypothetical protein
VGDWNRSGSFHFQKSEVGKNPQLRIRSNGGSRIPDQNSDRLPRLDQTRSLGFSNQLQKCSGKFCELR